MPGKEIKMKKRKLVLHRDTIRSLDSAVGGMPSVRSACTPGTYADSCFDTCTVGTGTPGYCMTVATCPLKPAE